jgi:hypothetical protein
MLAGGAHALTTCVLGVGGSPSSQTLGTVMARVLIPPDVNGNARTGSGKPFFAFQVSLTHPGWSVSGTLGL